MTAETVPEATPQTGALAGKYLTFVLADETYGLEILRVREIIGLLPISAVPHMPPHIKGVINLRGKVISVIDLRTKFGLCEAEHTDQTCIIVVNVRDVEMGVIVDHVSEVLDVDAGDIEPPPSFGQDVPTDFLLGIGKQGEQITLLLDISRVLDQDTACADDLTDAF